MKKKLGVPVLVAGILLMLCWPLSAHHGTNISYDQNTTLQLTGTVTEWRYAYPHPQVYLDVKDASGSVVAWAFELAPTPAMMRALNIGWSQASVKVGDQMMITYRPSKVADSKVGLAIALTLNGKPMPLTAQQAQPQPSR